MAKEKPKLSASQRGVLSSLPFPAVALWPGRLPQSRLNGAAGGRRTAALADRLRRQ